MGKLKVVGYELRDVAVIQAPVSFINHREEADPFVNICDRSVYPVFVAPMAAVTDENNYKIWIDNKVTPVVPRNIGVRLSFSERMKIAEKTFVSISLKEAQEQLIEYVKSSDSQLYICIDIAHGTLSDLYNISRDIKRILGDQVVLMTGNIANPGAYSFYADSGIDWVRVGIGGGSRCTSSANVSVHYPMATLLDQLNEERKAYSHSHNGNAPTKIIADGGIGWFDDIQKSLALGADAVMIGKLFAECDEACGEVFNKDGIRVEPREFEWFRTSGHELTREYYGMSTKRAQTETGGSGNRTSEGISKPVVVKHPVAKWIDNMQSYLRSCMTYTNSRTIKEMRENSQVIILGGSGDAAYRK